MDRDTVWQAIDDQRLSLANLLEQLTQSQWQQPSLCAGWTVRDVTAHLTLQQVTLGEALKLIARSPGPMTKTIHDSACHRAATWSTAQMIDAIRGMVGSQRRNFGVTYRDTLIDILVHGQDIAIPVRREHPIPPAVAAVAATRAWTTRWPRPILPHKRFAGYRLTATDTDWSVGEGEELRGPISAILLVIVGRSVALAQLSGAATSDIAARFAVSS